MNEMPEENYTILNESPVLGELLEMLDTLHSAASDGELTSLTPQRKRELTALLREVVYTAQETIQEIEAQRVITPFLRILPRNTHTA